MTYYTVDPQAIVEFWREAGPDRWFGKDEAFDETIRRRFGDVYERAARGELDSWQEEPTGILALILLLDQFPRNMFRGTPLAFATDAKALELAKTALARGDHMTVAEDINQFLVMPLMHCEDLAEQDECVAWMEKIGDEANVASAREHREILDRFGRFPHRNAILGRESSPEETEFLENGGFAG
ncbi:DUF924 family protein [Aurantimonas sp. VKM B-3413]|uniref:DUF924 family protein n=1 Tax=Aurantimonas sp. VKM B-3413 TaxID=2779401 RepID=UPI001E5D1E75|nr:DUF924 family protein [Aurantimonas sp. VKM B-3413]MCB8839285.1 DUF924 domain-containing protein [Aurantimonas sp. VKM B-3413]